MTPNSPAPPAAPPGIALVVADLAGTLVDCGSRAPVQAFAAAFEAFQVPVTESEIRRFMGTGKKDHIRELLRLPRVEEAWKSRHGREWEEEDVEGVYARLLPLQADAVKKALDPCPHVAEALDLLAEEGVPFATTTGYPRAVATPIVDSLRHAGHPPVASLFEDDVPSGRPAPWMIFRAMEAAHIAPPARVLNIGDTPLDVASGVAAGAWSLGVTLTGSGVGLENTKVRLLDPETRTKLHAQAAQALHAAGAHAVVETLEELPRVLAAIAKRVQDGRGPGFGPLEGVGK